MVGRSSPPVDGFVSISLKSGGGFSLGCFLIFFLKVGGCRDLDTGGHCHRDVRFRFFLWQAQLAEQGDCQSFRLLSNPLE